jgi:Na+-translocating ferredoxin:NAD+ oxidoreductase RnfG subunit
MKIASIVLFVLALASLALTANALKSTKAQLAHVQAQLADEVAHASELQHALQAERVANNEYLEKTKKADETRDAFMRVARDLDVVPIDDGVRQSAIDAYKSLICADSVASSR